MALERDLELLDDYMANRLGEKEKLQFEQKLSSDPSLMSEYKFQQMIVGGIQNTRKLELKSMLNNIPVTAIPTGPSVLSKAAATIIFSAILVSGVYVFLKLSKEESKIQTPIEVRPSVTESKDEVKTEPVQPKFESEKESVSVEEKAPVKKKAVTKTLETQKPAINAYDPSSEINSGNTSEEEAAAASSPVSHSSITVETNSDSKRYKFHYQVIDGKVRLYGEFEKDLYEILEFFSGSKRTMFLYYKNNYYLLTDDTNKVKPLSAINDPVLLKKLKEYRND